MDILKTPLYKQHIQKNGNMVPFSGYLLPTYYSGIKKEHMNVRNNIGLFDVSHMGEFIISGNDSMKFLNYVTTNDVSTLINGQAQYTAICNHDGGIIDDLLVYKKENEFMLVVNAANRMNVFGWLRENIKGNIVIKDISDELGLLALQGPKSRTLLQKMININIASLPFYHFITSEIRGYEVLISRTGYTGELGFELFASNQNIIKLWDDLLDVGREYGISPSGLGCRDTLRMEMRYALHGNDIDINANPIEAGLGWITKLEKGPFIGRNAIFKSKQNLNKKLICFQMCDKAIPRNGCALIIDDEIVGKVTSGTMSPSLGKGIGIAYVKKEYAKTRNNIIVDIRGKRKKAIIVKPPFYKDGSLLN